MSKKRGKIFQESDLHETVSQRMKKSDSTSDSSSENKENEISNKVADIHMNDSSNEEQDQDVDQTDPGDDSFLATTSAGQSEMSDIDDAGTKEKSELEFVVNPVSILEYRMLPRDRVLVLMEADKEIFFKGSLQISVLKGCVTCQGYKMFSSRSYRNIYSPRGHSLLSLQASIADNFTDILPAFLTEEEITDLKTENKIAFVARKLSEPWMEYLVKNLYKAEKLNLFGRDNLKEVDSLTELEKLFNITIFRPNKISTKLWRKGQDWDIAVTSLEITLKNGGQPRLLAAGGKGVGKSSFLRWMTNQVLNFKSELLFLDLDPGQKEFGLPGYLSLVCVTKPVLGPNFCQPDPKWEKSVYFGDINVAQNPKRYVDCLKLLLGHIKKDTDIPVLVNTMGWCQGLGLALNIEVIKRIQPTTVVQLNSRFTKKNFTHSLSCDVVNKRKSTWSHSTSRLSYSLLEFMAVPERKSAKDMTGKCSWGIPQPSVLRDIKVISWLGRRPQLKELPVYSIPFSSVSLHVLDQPVPDRGLLAALTFKLVDLCHVDVDNVRQAVDGQSYSILKSGPLSLSSGVGLIRGVDAEKKLIYVATQTKEEDLQNVNCLVGGALDVPTAILKLQKSGPYLDAKPENNPLDLPWQKNQKLGAFASRNGVK